MRLFATLWRYLSLNALNEYVERGLQQIQKDQEEGTHRVVDFTSEELAAEIARRERAFPDLPGIVPAVIYDLPVKRRARA